MRDVRDRKRAQSCCAQSSCSATGRWSHVRKMREVSSMHHGASTLTLLLRVLAAFALTFVLGYERELRGSTAGDRTFSLIGVAAALLGILAGAGSPNAVAGGVTGIGFIGGGIVFRRAVGSGELISGITTAST